MPKLFTIGYEGANVDQLVATLSNVGIEFLADVRELPLSRKKGLSKNSLAANLASAGIEYRHFRQLGDPKPGRDAARLGKYDLFESIFSAHLRRPETQASLANLLEVASTKLTCMLCFERCHTRCHRSYLADGAISYGFEVFNLVPDRPEKYLENDFSIPRYNSRKSLSAAE